MANTFPSTGNAGIGTTTRSDPLTIDTGTGFALARIRGRSPAWVAGASGCGTTGQAYVGLVTVAGDYLGASAVGDTFLVPASNTGITYVGRTGSNQPVMAIHNAVANVAIGLGNTSPPGRRGVIPHY